MSDKNTQTMEEEQVSSEAGDDSLQSEQQELDENEARVEQEGDSEQEQEGKSQEEFEAEIAELQQRVLRVQADYDNFRRRSREERESAAKYRSQPFIEGLLPVLDNFERALLVKPEQDETKSLLQGMEMVYRQMLDVLNNEGVEVIETVGQKFDPQIHQAVMQVEEEGFESNQIVEELQKGYKLKDRVIRPSMVKVNA